LEIVATYSHKAGSQFIEKNHPEELREIFETVRAVDAERFKTKVSKEKTMEGTMLYSPVELNDEFKRLLQMKGWDPVRINVETRIPETAETHRGFREIDMVKNGLGLEIQFGKYAFMMYNVAAKMTIFSKQGIMDSGVEVVAMRHLTEHMSTGVSFFEQMKTDLEYRGEADIDIPVLVLGIDIEKPQSHQTTLSD
jgi:hypothetical protein